MLVVSPFPFPWRQGSRQLLVQLRSLPPPLPEYQEGVRPKPTS